MAFHIIAGPCSVESQESILSIAKAVKKEGATHLRGGAFKPRTTPDSFQGLGEEGLQYLQQAKQETGLPIVTEIMDVQDIPLFEKYGVDIYQIGTRNMQNYSLLKALGQLKGKTFLLKRGMVANLKEILGSLQYLNPNENTVYFCERGIRTSANSEYSRNVLDLGIVPVIQKEGYKVIVDPSHAAGRRDLVLPLAKAAIAAGADGLIIEVHTEPDKAKSDAAQTIGVDTFREIVAFSKP